MAVISAQEWQNSIQNDPDVSLLQSSHWGELKSAFGWTPVYIRTAGAGAMVLFRKLPLGLSAAYIPRGPIGNDFAGLWDEVHRLCRQRHAVFLRVEPNQWENSEYAQNLAASMQGFRPAFATVQPPRTIMLDLSGSPEDWLSRMNQKTRYNIRLSQKKDLVLDQTPDAAAFHQLMSTTGERDTFGVHSQAYYQRCIDCFTPSGQVHVLFVRYQGIPLAALMLFIQGKRAYYLYGASSNEERNRMPNHFLQWNAMQISAAAGCTEYDLWGIPDESESELEAHFTERQDGLWPVYRFKRGFGGTVLRTMGSFDYVYQPIPYQAAVLLKRIS